MYKIVMFKVTFNNMSGITYNMVTSILVLSATFNNMSVITDNVIASFIGV